VGEIAIVLCALCDLYFMPVHGNDLRLQVLKNKIGLWPKPNLFLIAVGKL
jgi:hypothetical protein